MDKLKRAVIKEELVAITGDYKLAIVLQQFLYWTERMGFDRYNKWVEEETTREHSDYEELKGGWIYKTASELVEEIMIGVSDSTARRYIKKLIKQGYLFERDNPKYKWDNTKQYRINLQKLVLDLDLEGYHLEGYKYDDLLKPFKCQHFQNENSEHQNEHSFFDNEKTIPKITIENTNTNITNKREKGNSQAIPCHYFLFDYETEQHIRSAIKYYMRKYQVIMEKEHPPLKLEQWETVVEKFTIISEPNSERIATDITYEQLQKMIDIHFETEYKNCDYNINHFVSEGVISRRYYEIGGCFESRKERGEIK